jgi:small GTP-binding protein
MAYTHVFKLLLLGDANVGKSSILLSFLGKEFKNAHMSTIGIDFGTKIVRFKDTNIKLQIWDTAGQERFHSVAKSYYNNIAGVIMVFDITNKESFNNLNYWIDQLDGSCGKSLYKNEYGEYSRYPPIILVGNKSDLSDDNREVYNGEIMQFVDKNSIDLYVEASAKDKINVIDIFHSMVDIIHEHIKFRGDGLAGITCPHSDNSDFFAYGKRKYKCCFSV